MSWVLKLNSFCEHTMTCCEPTKTFWKIALLDPAKWALLAPWVNYALEALGEEGADGWG